MNQNGRHENMNYHTHGKNINAKHGMEIMIIQTAANDCLSVWNNLNNQV